MNHPDSHPVLLKPYTHLAPEDGMCLMEYVSVLAGTEFSDHPACTDALLGALARAVNDAMSDQGRCELLALASALAESGPERPGEDRITYHCWDAVAAASPPGSAAQRRARRRRDTALAPHAAARRAEGVLRWVRVHGPARRAVETAVRTLAALPPGEADRSLYRLLACCIEEARGHTAKHVRPAVSA
ncbi:hypothetical protein ABZ508_14120 [Streptomyces lavendulocolor]|uniref:Uncharacterized protein n=1 Tax=Streptomyces lavendulocolor TaxID=67316 RepID=A0ABV2W4M6_9ACTN